MVGVHEGVKIKATFEGLGWNVRLQQRRHQYFFSLVREIAIGNALRKGDKIFYYLVELDNKRKAILVFLDGEQRPNGNTIKLKGTSFLVRK